MSDASSRAAPVDVALHPAVAAAVDTRVEDAIARILTPCIADLARANRGLLEAVQAIAATQSATAAGALASARHVAELAATVEGVARRVARLEGAVSAPSPFLSRLISHPPDG